VVRRRQLAGKAVVYLAARLPKLWDDRERSGAGASMSSYLIEAFAARQECRWSLDSDGRRARGQGRILEAAPRWRLAPLGEERGGIIRHFFPVIRLRTQTLPVVALRRALDNKGLVRNRH